MTTADAMSGADHFDLLGPLPSGRLSIEASAGTGKTYALAALATRFLAERDITTSDLLIVTFTRAATSELRARVRERLVQAAHHLEHGGDTDDELLEHLASADRELRLARLARAVTEFDAATVTTIHGFATQVRATLGVQSGSDPHATMVDDSAQLAAECCADVLAAAALRHEQLPKFSTLVMRTRTAINIADLRLAPGVDQEGMADPADLLMVELVERSIERMRQRRRAAATVSFDDVLVDLRRSLRAPGSAAALQNRFRVALIDEFQDTDPVQWDIFRTMFPDPDDPDTALVLVGDPKQSIYAFRGANVHTYLGAMRSTGRRPPTLATNWRSDGALLQATATLLRGTTFGDDAIAFSDVAAAPAHRDRRLHDAAGEPWPAISLRLAIDPELPRTKKGQQLEASEVRAAIESDLVAQVRHLLDTARLPVDGDGPGDAHDAPVNPSDIAVLVRSNQDAERVRDALKLQGIPAVLARGGSVLDAPAADQWRWLLDAMLRPSDPVRARTFALSWFGGRSAEWVAGADDEDLVELQEQLSEWASVLGERGVTDFQRRLWVDSGVVARVLARPDGDRELTDLEHIAELLGTGAGVEHQSVAGLLSVLDAPAPVEIDADIDRDQAARRVESEARAVQVMTVWVAKGLEFPIVCVPTMWSAPSSPTILPDDGSEGGRVYDLAAKSWPDAAATKERKRLAAAESLGEGLRLLYVALTRARHHTVLWWSSPSGANRSALARVLFARDADGRLDPEAFRADKLVLPPDEDTAARLAPLVEAAGGTISLGVHGRVRPPADRWTPPSPAGADAELDVARLERHLDRSGRRWSFTAISAGDQHRHDGGDAAHDDPTDASGGDAGAADEGPGDLAADADDLVASTPGGPGTDGSTTGAASAGVPSAGAASAGTASAGAPAQVHLPALATLPAGATFGTLVHSVLEHVDFSSHSLAEDLRAEVLRQLEFRPIDLAPRAADGTRGDPEAGLDLLVQGLFDALDTPMGELLGERRLRDWSPTDRLDELDFDLRLGSGHGAPTDAELGALIESHLAPADLFDQQPLHDWAATLVDGRFDAVLAGHLTGSIDAVLRMPGDDGEPRFVVVDYKTNRLTPRGALASSDDYAPAKLVQAMAEHHYPLQALLYSVALHRYLRWRQPGYDPAAHLGGVAYLFVRGMVGATTPVTDGMRHGAFTWNVPTGLVVELSDLLAAPGELLTGAER